MKDSQKYYSHAIIKNGRIHAIGNKIEIDSIIESMIHDGSVLFVCYGSFTKNMIGKDV